MLDGNLLQIKREFGRNQLVVSDGKRTQEDMEKLLHEKMSEYVEITGKTKEDVIVKLLEGVSRNQFLQRLVSMGEIELEHYETYKPSLNDIFVTKVGEES